VAYRLAWFLAKKRDELLNVLIEQIGELKKKLFSLFNRSLWPGKKRSFCSGNGIVEILLGTDWDIPELLASGWVYTMVDVLWGAVLGVDNVVEVFEIESGHLGGRHGCGLVENAREKQFTRGAQSGHMKKSETWGRKYGGVIGKNLILWRTGTGA
jgi:hypothetical protein